MIGVGEYPGRRTCARFSYIAGGLFLFSWALAVVLDGSWSFGTNTLSDLGISDNPGSVILFNFVACVLCAALWIVESVGITRSEFGFGHVYGVLATVAMVLLMLIGVVNKGFGRIHIYVALSYMAVTAVSMVVACLSEFYRRKRHYAAFTVFVMAVCVISYLTMPFAGCEAVSILMTVLWAMTVAEAYGSYHGGNNEETYAEASGR